MTVDTELMRHAGRLDGFWLLVTNHTKHEHGGFRLPAQELIPPYQEKAVIESAFRDLKSYLERILGKLIAQFHGLLRSQNQRFNPDFALLEKRFPAIRGFSENVSENPLDIRPVYVWTDVHVRAHYTACVLAPI